VHGGALIYAKHTWLVLEPPSDKQQEYARLSENERLHVTQRERFLLEAREGKLTPQNVGGEQNADGIIRDPSSAHSIPLKDSAHYKTPRGVLTTKDWPTFKRKCAKAPNPLSCLKKKKKVVNPASTEEVRPQLLFSLILFCPVYIIILTNTGGPLTYVNFIKNVDT
jgi:U3 small nucleolar RNA-associated protein 23